MAFVENEALVVKSGDILISEEYLGIGYGFKVLKEVYLGDNADPYYIAQYGEVTKGDEWKPYNDGADLSLVKASGARSSHKKTWVKGPSLKDGDVLVSKDNRQVFVVRGLHNGEPKLYRVTGGDGMFDRLSNYEATYGKLSQAHYNFSGGRFSDAV